MNADIFNTPRAEGEVDLVEKVRNAIMLAGCGLLIEQAFDQHQCVMDAKNLCGEAQRFLLNRYFYLQLTSCNVSSMEERFCLVETGDLRDWYRLFEQKIIPFMIANKLPKLVQYA